MVKRRVLAIPYSTIFICQLPEETQKIIRADLEECAREQEEELLMDEESGDYMGLSRRFCDISHIYQHTDLVYCKPGEEPDNLWESKEMFNYDKRVCQYND